MLCYTGLMCSGKWWNQTTCGCGITVQRTLNWWSLKWCAELVFKCRALCVFSALWTQTRNTTHFFFLILEFVFLGMQVLEWNGIPLTSKTYEEVQSIIGQQSGEAEICVRLWVFPHLFVSIFLAIHGAFNLKLLRWKLCQSARFSVIRT